MWPPTTSVTSQDLACEVCEKISLKLSAFHHAGFEGYELLDLVGDVLLVLIQDSVLIGLVLHERCHQLFHRLFVCRVQ